MCKSYIEEGFFDDKIRCMIEWGADDNYIVVHLMDELNGHENPKQIIDRIKLLRKNDITK